MNYVYLSSSIEINFYLLDDYHLIRIYFAFAYLVIFCLWFCILFCKIFWFVVFLSGQDMDARDFSSVSTIMAIAWGYGFSSGHVWMWKLDYKESWVLKNWYFRTVVLKKTLESPLDCKEIKLVNPKGNQPWIFIGRTDAEAPILWPPDSKSRLIGKGLDSGKDWGQEEKGVTEDEMVG